jgi:hypothetical protein
MTEGNFFVGVFLYIIYLKLLIQLGAIQHTLIRNSSPCILSFVPTHNPQQVVALQEFTRRLVSAVNSD